MTLLDVANISQHVNRAIESAKSEIRDLQTRHAKHFIKSVDLIRDIETRQSKHHAKVMRDALEIETRQAKHHAKVMQDTIKNLDVACNPSLPSNSDIRKLVVAFNRPLHNVS